MSNSGRAYLAGVCHGTAAAAVVAYVLWHAGVTLDYLFRPGPTSGVLPAPLLLLPFFLGNYLLMRNAQATRTAGG